MIYDGLPNLGQLRGFRMPYACSEEVLSRLNVKVQSGRRVSVSLLVPEFHCKVRLVEALVLRESYVAIDSEERASKRFGIRDQLPAYLSQLRASIFDESKARLQQYCLVSF